MKSIKFSNEELALLTNQYREELLKAEKYVVQIKEILKKLENSPPVSESIAVESEISKPKKRGRKKKVDTQITIVDVKPKKERKTRKKDNPKVETNAIIENPATTPDTVVSKKTPKKPREQKNKVIVEQPVIKRKKKSDDVKVTPGATSPLVSDPVSKNELPKEERNTKLSNKNSRNPLKKTEKAVKTGSKVSKKPSSRKSNQATTTLLQEQTEIDSSKSAAETAKVAE